MRRIISLFISIIFLSNISFAYTVKVKVGDIGFEVTADAGEIIQLESKNQDIVDWEVTSENTTIEDNKFTMPPDNVEINAVLRRAPYSIDTSPVTYADSLSEAVGIAGTGNTISLLENVTETTLVTVPDSKTLTLNLGGNTITTETDGFITVNGGFTVTDTADGKIISTNASGKLINVSGSGKLVVNSGTIENTNSEGTAGAGVIYSNSATTTINLGSNDGVINNYPKISSGNGKGIFSKGTVNYYDGEVVGVTDTIHAVTDAYATGKTLGEATVSGKKVSKLVVPYTTSGLVNYYSAKWNRGYGTHQSSPNLLADLKGNKDGQIYETAEDVKSASKANGVYGADYLTFDGKNDWVDIGKKDYTTLTLETVFEINEFTGDEMYLITNINSAGYALNIDGTNSYAGFQVVNQDGTYSWVHTPTAVKNKTKYHLVGTYDGTTARTYLNGVLVSEKTNCGTIKTSPCPVVLGGNPGLYSSATGVYGGKNEWFNGKIYMARVYNRALTADEVAANYENEMYGKDLYKVHSGYTLSNNGCCTACAKQMYSSFTLSWTGGTYTTTDSHGSVILYKGKTASGSIPSTYTTGKSLYGSTTRLIIGTPTFSSSNTGVATVSSSGTPTVKKAGIADITVSCNGLSAKYRIFAANTKVNPDSNLYIRQGSSSGSKVGRVSKGTYAIVSSVASNDYVVLYGYQSEIDDKKNLWTGYNGGTTKYYILYNPATGTEYSF